AMQGMPPMQGMPAMQGRPPYDMQYTSMPNPNVAPVTMDNNVPSMESMHEDCGCDGEPELYSPQPGIPYFPREFHQQNPYIPYTPQPGTMYYQQNPPSVFGTLYPEEEN
ncbi:peptigoglycan-binding protein LysM, partial [Bacillus sp. JJ864]